MLALISSPNSAEFQLITGQEKHNCRVGTAMTLESIFHALLSRQCWGSTCPIKVEPRDITNDYLQVDGETKGNAYQCEPPGRYFEPPRRQQDRVCASSCSSVYCHTLPSRSATPNLLSPAGEYIPTSSKLGTVVPDSCFGIRDAFALEPHGNFGADRSPP